MPRESPDVTIFERDGTVAEYERGIAELEQLLGQEDVGIAL